MADQFGPPNFETMAEQLTAGAQKSGFYVGLAKAIANGLADAFATIVGTLLNLITQIAVFIVQTILATLREADPAMVTLARTAVADLLGTDFPPIEFSLASSTSGARRAENQQLGRGIMRALFGSLSISSTTLEPGSAAAETYLGVVTSLGIKGWFEGLVGEIESLGFVKDFGELRNVLATSLGLGRMSRAVMRPIVSTLLVTPFEWQLKNTYRPNLHTEAHAIALYAGGTWTFPRLEQELSRQGWSSDRILQLVDLHGKQWSVSELQTLLEMGLLTFDQTVAELKCGGDDERHATYRIFASERRALESHASALVSDAVDRYIGRRLSRFQLDQILQSLLRAPDQLATILNYADLRRSFPRTVLSLNDSRDAVKRGLWDLNHFTENMRAHGFSEDDANTQELLLLAEIRGTNQAADEKRAHAERQAADRAAAIAAAEARKIADQARAAAARLADRRAAEAKAQAARAAVETRRQFAVDAATARRQLVETQHLAGTVTAAQLADADVAAAVAIARANAAASNQLEDLKVAFADRIAELRRADKLDGYQLALDQVDADEADGTTTPAAAAKRRAAVTLARAQYELTADQDAAAVARGAREAADIAKTNAEHVSAVVARQRSVAARGAASAANLAAAQRATEALDASLEARRRALETQLHGG